VSARAVAWFRFGGCSHSLHIHLSLARRRAHNKTCSPSQVFAAWRGEWRSRQLLCVKAIRHSLQRRVWRRVCGVGGQPMGEREGQLDCHRHEQPERGDAWRVERWCECEPYLGGVAQRRQRPRKSLCLELVSKASHVLEGGIASSSNSSSHRVCLTPRWYVRVVQPVSRIISRLDFWTFFCKKKNEN
jgi:hypothetical protein